MAEELKDWGTYKKADLTDAVFLEQQSVQVGDTPAQGETRAYRNALYPEKLVNFVPTRPGCDTLYSLLEYMVKNEPEKPWLGTRPLLENGEFGDYVFETYGDAGARRKRVGDGMKKVLGTTKRCEPIGIFAKNRAEWLIAEHAAYVHGMTPVALYDTLGANAVSYVIEHSEMRILFASGDHIAALVSNRSEYPGLEVIVSLENEIVPEHLKVAEENKVQLMLMSDLEKLGEENVLDSDPCKVDDLATIMYTSGSTGNPKGVQLPHRAMLAVTSALYFHDVGPVMFAPDVKHFSYLPLAHSFERAAASAILIAGGKIGFFTGDLKNLLSDLGALAPTFMIGAPRVFQRIHDRIKAKVGAGSFIKRGIFNLAYWWKSGSLASGGHAMAHSQGGWTDSVVFKNTNALLGGACKMIVSGSAPLDPQVGEFLRVVLCVPILQGYGLTENSAGATVGYRMDGYAVSHVGPPLPSIELKLVDVAEMNYTVLDKPYPRGEVCLRGPSVFTGYFKDPERTAEDLKEDGWFHTGDIGEMGKGGVLRIIDRKKNIFKLSQGEYVAAEYLEQIFVYGDSLRNYLVAVIVPSPDTIPPVAKAKGVASEELEEICKSDGVRDAILASMVEAGKAANLHGFEFIKAIYLEHEAFSVENDLLTPTFKPRRVQLKAKYKTIIDQLYEKL